MFTAYFIASTIFELVLLVAVCHLRFQLIDCRSDLEIAHHSTASRDQSADYLRRKLVAQRAQIEEMVDRSVELRNERDELKDVLAKVETCSYDLDGVLFGDDDPRTDAEAITEDDQGDDTE